MTRGFQIQTVRANEWYLCSLLFSVGRLSGDVQFDLERHVIVAQPLGGGLWVTSFTNNIIDKPVRPPTQTVDILYCI